MACKPAGSACADAQHVGVLQPAFLGGVWAENPTLPTVVDGVSEQGCFPTRAEPDFRAGTSWTRTISDVSTHDSLAALVTCSMLSLLTIPVLDWAIGYYVEWAFDGTRKKYYWACAKATKQ